MAIYKPLSRLVPHHFVELSLMDFFLPHYRQLKSLTFLCVTLLLCALMLHGRPVQAQWVPHSLPGATPDPTLFNIDTQALVVVDTPSGSVLFASGQNSQFNAFYRSEDNGASWMPQPLRLKDGAPAVDDPGLRVMWAATLPMPQASSSRTADLYVAVIRPPSNILQASFTCDLLRSDDVGATWSVIRRSSPVCAITIDPSARNWMYGVEIGYIASGRPNVHRSADGGASWEYLNNKLPASVQKVRVGIDGTAYAIAGSRLFVSHDQGASWTRSDTPQFTLGGITAVGDIIGLRHPVHGDRYAVIGTANGLFTTTDSGGTWQPAGLQGFPITSLDTLPGTSIFGMSLLVAYSGGVALFDGISIVPFSSGLPQEPTAYLLRANGYAITTNTVWLCTDVDACRGGILPSIVTLVEYHNMLLDHYFMTSYPAEMEAIDTGGAGPGWSRTGVSFQVPASRIGSAGSSNVCRFYGTPGIGPNSHFFTPNSTECQIVRGDRGWLLESPSAFASRTPQITACNASGCNGFCPTGSTIYRLYNNKLGDSNHRYVIDATTYREMQQQGWILEGPTMCTAW